MKTLITIALTAGILMGCTTGTIITQDGTTEKPKWHKVEKVILNKHLGTFPNLENLNQIKEGMTKDQINELIGRPQYDDGWRPREWNYLFHFKTSGQRENDITTCQFKILFDKNMFARSFYWNLNNPQDGTCPPAFKAQAKEPVAEKLSTKRYTLEEDALFIFDKSDIQDLNPKGRKDLENMVVELGKYKVINSIRITGYTDRLGAQPYNQRLSLNRAESIKQHLVNRGLNPDIIISQGRGSEKPVKGCGTNLSRIELINCLAPNRRVIIDVDGYVEK
ncbi:outer membrane protein assembly factor BamE [Acinetobacter bereziniae]|uniref:OmpA family protein n=1 Tax=Acinetobacter bereziniae TaxID=106648 RepID=UPI00190144A3|nr:OmpA family protein [Acinetobacter bereziniae]MBJ9947572.1 outer membrane protein assembly factor BamE [Acinetobacter bereziniae]